jgi:DHA2 family multidrug resistance protein
MTLEALERLRTRQALSLAYFDVFSLLAAFAALLLLLIPLIRRSVAEKGQHAAAE